MTNRSAPIFDLIDPLLLLAAQAGKKIMAYFGQEQKLNVQRKSDNTVITQADLAAHQVIFEGLTHLTPDIPVLSEEGTIPSYEIRQHWQQYWLVDPLDGTRGFLQKDKEFSVNIALIENHLPVLGIIYIPASNVYYYACQNRGAFKRENNQSPTMLKTHPLNWDQVRVLVGRFQTSSRLAQLFASMPGFTLSKFNSSFKLAKLAEGQGDFYPRFGPTSEWDTAAGQCILTAAGGVLVDLKGQPLQYNTKNSLLNPPFVAVSDATQTEKILKILWAIKNQIEEKKP